jgi:negative regulator of flagellin synthesis FlgM
MRVNPNVSQGVQGNQTEGLKKSEQAAKPERARQIEQVSKNKNVEGSARAEISDKARDFAKAHAAASSAPDVREDRIADIKRRIAAGDYKVDSDKVAEKMLGEHAAL